LSIPGEPARDDATKKHPCLVPCRDLTEAQKWTSTRFVDTKLTVQTPLTGDPPMATTRKTYTAEFKL